MNLNNEEEVLGLLTRLLDQLHQADLKNFGSKIEIVYVASGGQHVENLYNGPLPSPFPSEARLPVAFPRRRGDSHADEGVPLPEWRGESHAEETQLPEAAVMAKAVEATVAEGLWATNTCWSVVYMVYRMRGYNGGVSDFVREVDTWPFKRPIGFSCNRDSVGKPIREGRMSMHLERWLGNGVQRTFCRLAEALIESIDHR